MKKVDSILAENILLSTGSKVEKATSYIVTFMN